MIDTRTPLTGGWWLKRLSDKLAARRPHYEMLQRYLDNESAMPVATSRAVRQAYQRLMQLARMDYAELIVDAVRERQAPIGFRTGADSDELGDKAAWRIFQASQLDADAGILHQTALGLGRAYTLVGGPDDETGEPVITIEDPRQVIVEHDPVRRRRPVAALKIYHDDIEGRWRAFLYLPGVVRQAASGAVKGPAWDTNTDFQDWSWTTGPEELPPTARNLIPVIEFANHPAGGRPWGEFERHLPCLDRIQYQILQRLEIATMQAFKLRVMKGLPQKDPVTGQKIDYDDIFAADPGAMWALPAAADLWESGTVDLSPIRLAVQDDVRDLAAVTRTPLYYLVPDAGQGSAEGAALAREGLIYKIKDRNRQFGESWERTIAIAFLMKGDARRAAQPDMEIIWADPQNYSLAELYDAAVKAKAAGVPWRQVMRLLQHTPPEIDRMEAERVSDALQASLLAPPPPVAPPPPGAPQGAPPPTGAAQTGTTPATP